MPNVDWQRKHHQPWASMIGIVGTGPLNNWHQSPTYSLVTYDCFSSPSICLCHAPPCRKFSLRLITLFFINRPRNRISLYRHSSLPLPIPGYNGSRRPLYCPQVSGVACPRALTCVCSVLFSPLSCLAVSLPHSRSHSHTKFKCSVASLSHGHTMVRIVFNDLHDFLNLYLPSCFSFPFLKYYSTLKVKTRWQAYHLSICHLHMCKMHAYITL